MKKLWNWSLIFLILFFLFKSLLTQKLIALVILLRHGDRTPVSFYANDPYKDEKYWPLGISQLTNKGKQRLYDVGLKLQNIYSNFLSNNPREAYFQSSDKDRCLESIFYLASGLYPPNGHSIWNSSKFFQAFPIHTTPEIFDRMLNYKSPCPKRDEERKFIENLNETKTVIKHFADTLNYCEYYSGEVLTTTTQAQKLYDTLKIELEANLTLPKWVNHQVLSDLAQLEVFDFYFFCRTQSMQKFILSAFFQELKSYQLAMMKNGTNQTNYKLKMFSTHDIIISCVLSAFEVFSMKPPPYASSLLFELWNTNNDEFETRLMYFNETNKNPTLLHLPFCNKSYSCSQAQFHQLLDYFIIQDWDTNCGLISISNKYKSYSILLIFILTFVFMFFFVKFIPTKCFNRNYFSFS